MKNALVLTLSLSLTFSPLAQARDEDGRFTPAPKPEYSVEQVAKANALIAEHLSGNIRLPKTLPGLRNNSKVIKAAKAANFVQGEVLQISSTMIVLAALTFKAAQDRADLKALAGGKDLNSAPRDSDAPYCGANRDASTAEDVLCSGDFLMGLVAGGAFGASVGAMKIFMYFLKTPKTRVPFLNLAVGLFSMSLMMSMAQASSLLWIQSTKYLDENESALAHGLAGRAALARMSGHWAEFQNTADGALLNKMAGIMYDIVVQNAQFRDQWLYNVWRFGLARGEFIASVATLMAANTAGAGIAVALGVTVPMAGAILGGIFGVAALYALFSSNAPQALTSVLQNVRQSWARNKLMQNAEFITFLSDRFQLRNYPGVDNDYHVRMVQKYMDQSLSQRYAARDDFANVGIEKYFELKMETERLNQKIRIAEKVINETDLNKNLYFDADGQILSYADVMKKTCVQPKTDPNQAIGLGAWSPTPKPCDDPLALQLRTIQDSKKLIKEANQELPKLAMSLVNLYENDRALARGINANGDVLLPFTIARQVDEFETRSQALRDNFQKLFSVLDNRLAAVWNIQWGDDPTERKQLDITVRGIFDSYYSFGMSENIVYPLLQQQNP